MKGRLEDRLSMALAAQQVLNDNASLWNSISAMVTEFSNLGTKIAEIEGARGIQEQDMKGVAIDKKEKKRKAIEAALPVIGSLKAFAIASEDNTLLKKIDYTRAQIEKARDTILVDQLKIVRDEANANVTALADYNLTQTEINTLTSAITAYELMVPKTRVALNVRKNATEALDRLFHELNLPLEILDGLMETLSQTQPDFFSTYKNARRIAGSSNAGSGVHGTVRDKLTGAPLTDVKITINAPLHKTRVNAKSTTRTMTTTTNLDGIYKMRRLHAGTYILTMEREGYNVLQVETEIKEEGIAKADGEMERSTSPSV